MAESSTDGPAPKLRVFLSYSRRDADFVRKLADALTARGYLADFDQSTHHAATGDTGISATDDWWLRLQDMIAAADVMVLSVSPDSAASKVVDEEIAYARSLSKRVVAITCREVDFANAPPRLSALNVNHWFIRGEFEPALAQLCDALDRDIAWLRRSSSYTVQAKAWSDAEGAMAKNRTDRLLTGVEIAEAEAWSARRPANAPEVSELILSWLAASRRAQTDRENKEKRNIRNTRGLQRLIGIATLAAFLITLTGAWFVVNGQRGLARAQSAMMAAASDQLGDTTGGLRLAVLANHETFLTPVSDEARRALASRALASGLQLTLTHEAPVTGAVFSQDGKRILSWSEDGKAQLWDIASGKKSVLQHDGPVAGAVFTRREDRVLTWSGNTVHLWDAATAKEVMPPLKHDDTVRGASIVDASYYVRQAEEPPPSTYILSWSDDGAARVWDAGTGKQVGFTLQHNGPVFGATFSSNQQRILTWSEEGAAHLWTYWQREPLANPQSDKPLGYEMPHRGAVTGAVFLEDETRIVTWSSDRTAQVWEFGEEAKSSKPLILQHASPVVGGALYRAGRVVLVWGGDTARLWDASGWGQLGALRHDGAIAGAVFSPTDPDVLVWGGDTVRLWRGGEIETTLLALHEGGATGGAFSKNASRILTWGRDGAVRQWDAASHAEIGPAIRHDGAVLGVAYSADENHVLSWSSDGTVRVWEVGGNADIHPAGFDHDPVIGAAFSEDGKFILAWSETTARLLDSSTLASAGETIRRPGEISGAALAPDNRRAISWGDDAIQLTDLGTGQTIDIPEKSVAGAVLSKDGTLLFSWGRDGAAFLRSDLPGKTATLPLALRRTLSGAAFSGTGKLLVAWDDEAAHLWDTGTGKAPFPELRHDGVVSGAVFSANDSRVLTWSEDKTARLWDAATGQQVGPPFSHDRPVSGAVFSADETSILTWDENAAHLWDVATAKRVGAPMQHDRAVTGAIFSPDARSILTWGNDGAVRRWQAGSGRQIGPSFMHGGPVRGAAFSLSGDRILSWSDDRAVRLWDTATGAELGRPFNNGYDIAGAAFTSDQSRVLVWGGAVRLWDVGWAMKSGAASELGGAVCETRLGGGAVPAMRARMKDGRQEFAPILTTSGERLMTGPGLLTATDTAAMTTLQGREGEDVCVWSRPWYDNALRTLLGWAFP